MENRGSASKSPENCSPGLLVGQAVHAGVLLLLLLLAAVVWNTLGRPLPVVFWIAVLVPIVHQVFVLLAWRLELEYGTTSRRMGFAAYLKVFAVLFGLRFLSLGCLAWFDRGSLGLGEYWRVGLTVVLGLPALYALYSVRRYFGFERAAGGDHFEARYRDIPLVKEGIFRFTANGMYLYAFLIFWAIAIGFGSIAALVVAAYSHAYIWVHFYTTEKPNMNYLYGSVAK